MFLFSQIVFSVASAVVVVVNFTVRLCLSRLCSPCTIYLYCDEREKEREKKSLSLSLVPFIILRRSVLLQYTVCVCVCVYHGHE